MAKAGVGILIHKRFKGLIDSNQYVSERVEYVTSQWRSKNIILSKEKTSTNNYRSTP